LYPGHYRSVPAFIKNSVQAQQDSGVCLPLLYCSFHADGVHYKFKVGPDFWLLAADVAVDRHIGQQLVKVALWPPPG
jgi:hypothetical protein